MHHPPPRSGRCLVCGRPLDDAPYWITAHPDGEHTHCRNWEAIPFPFERDLQELRRVAGGLARAYRQVVAVGQWLAAVRRRWPRGAKRSVYEYEARKADLRERLARLSKSVRF